jgi:predicted Holliday junction resolvase-like endonuclease
MNSLPHPAATDANLLLIAAAALLVGLAVGAALTWIRLKLRHGREIRLARRQSVDQSRATLKGQIAEQLAPLLIGFPYAPADARFLGDPIDYVVFHNYTAMRDGQATGAPATTDEQEIEIVLIDIKRGRTAKLTPGQRAIAAAVRAGRVRFETIRIDDDCQVASETPLPPRRLPLARRR